MRKLGNLEMRELENERISKWGRVEEFGRKRKSSEEG